MLGEKDEEAARRYFLFSRVITPDIAEKESYKMLETFWESEERERTRILERLKVSEGLVSRTVSYDPPPGSVPIDLKKGCHRRLP
jgi:hypothetical protein